MSSFHTNSSSYIPHFLWKLWLSDSGNHDGQPALSYRLHAYDMYDNNLSEEHRIPVETRSVFHELEMDFLDWTCRSALESAARSFLRLESEAERALSSILRQTASLRLALPNSGRSHDSKELFLELEPLNALRKYFIFLRFRNGTKYQELLARSRIDAMQDEGDERRQSTARRLFLHAAIVGLQEYLEHTPQDNGCDLSVDLDILTEAYLHHQNLGSAEVCLGLAPEGHEFILTDTWYGELDQESESNRHYFFPISPKVALYLLIDLEPLSFQTPSPSGCLSPPPRQIEYDLESPLDVYQRNAMLLQTYPQHVYFSSLQAMVKSIAYYDERLWSPQNLDFSRLKIRCRQKSIREDVTKTLPVKGSIYVTDLTDDIVRLGDSAIAHGSFSDVWKGVWNDRLDPEERPKVVALKVLRQVMAQDLKQKLIVRLKDEVLAWHRLRHPHIQPLHGVVQLTGTLAMVSPWCSNGTIVHYLKGNPHANRLELLVQISSGLSYLHTFKPIVVHGDLKGANILIDDHGSALISDFGLSRVMEEFESVRIASSFFAGSTRWMAPELILALVQDDGRSPSITTQTDVYAFGSVCLEIATGELPYPHRTNDHAVTVDVMRGVKPSRGAHRAIGPLKHESLWIMMERCWDEMPRFRPQMSEVHSFLRALQSDCDA